MAGDLINFPGNPDETANTNTLPENRGLYLKNGVMCETHISKAPDGHHGTVRVQLCFFDKDNTQSYRRSFTMQGNDVSCETSNGEVVLTCDGKKVVLENVIPWINEISDWIAHPISSKQVVSQTSAQIHILTQTLLAQTA